MSARRSGIARAERKKLGWRCPKCKSRDRQTKEYPAEKVLLHVCQRCQFPQRVKVSD